MFSVPWKMVGNTSCMINHPSPSAFFLYIGENVKPFTPEKTKEIVMSLQQPAIFCNMVGDWPALHWNVEYLSAVLEGKTIQFRLGLKTVDLGENEVDKH